MYKKHGKICFSDRDTWNMNEVLKPIIGAALIKFVSVITKDDSFKGLPATVLQDCAELGIIPITYLEDYNLSDEDYFVAEKYYLDCLDKMIYAFTSEEPDPSSLYHHVSSEEMDKYYSELMAYNEKVQEGLDLFGRYYTTLWW